MLTGLRTGLIIVVFLSILCFPLLNEKFKLIKDLPNTENRRLARKPKLTENNYDVFPMKYEKYYNDHFSIRSYMLRYFNLYNIDVLQKSPLPDKLVIGKDGWLFMNETYMDAYTGKDSLTAQELEAFKQELEYRNEYLKQRNCKFYVMISPSKATVYNDLLPSSVYKITKQSWGEALLSYLQKNSSVKTINVFDELKSNAHKKQLYYKTDTHYSGWGGLYAANEFLKKINTDYADIIPFDINEFDENKTPKIKGNISDLLGNIKNFDDYVYELTPKKGIVAHTVNNIGYPCVDDFPYCDDFEHRKQITASKAPRLLIIADSFGNFIFPYLSEKFSTTELIFDGWQYKLNEDIVNHEKPDVMLLFMLESNLRNFLHHQSRLNKNKT